MHRRRRRGRATLEHPTSDPYGDKDDYIAHHEPFQYYESTANPHHLVARVTASTRSADCRDRHRHAVVCQGPPQFDTPNHQYDTSDFDQLVRGDRSRQRSRAIDLPAVSFLKAPGYEDGHAAYSDPSDEQRSSSTSINEIEQSPDW